MFSGAKGGFRMRGYKGERLSTSLPLTPQSPNVNKHEAAITGGHVGQHQGGHVGQHRGLCGQALGTMWPSTRGDIWGQHRGPCGSALWAMWANTVGHLGEYRGPCGASTKGPCGPTPGGQMQAQSKSNPVLQITICTVYVCIYSNKLCLTVQPLHACSK